MSRKGANFTGGPIYREAFRELTQPAIPPRRRNHIPAAPSVYVGPALKPQQSRRPEPPPARGAETDAARRDRAWLSAATPDQAAACRRLVGLRKGRARRPESLTGRLVGVLRRAERWLTTRELLDIVNDPAQTPPTASTRTVRGCDVAAYLAGYRNEGTVLARPAVEGTRLLEWRWAAADAADAEAAT